MKKINKISKGGKMAAVQEQGLDNGMSAEAKAALLKEKAMQDIGVLPACIDDRQFIFDWEGIPVPDGVLASSEHADSGPKWLGASLGPLALLVETGARLIESGSDGITLDFEEMIDFVFAAHNQADFEVAVHMDNHHGDLSKQQIAELLKGVKEGQEDAKIPGCGFAGLLVNTDNPLGMSQTALNFFTQAPSLVEEFVRRNAKLTVLTGDHADKNAGKAMAIRNRIPGRTIKQEEAHKLKTPSYCHDDLPLNQVLEELANVVGEKYEAWGEAIRQQAEEINLDWLNKTCNILAGMDPVLVE
ncbi:hypothetical protein ACFLZ1_00945 [Patescibacteria group bacterium]